jgi:hypothetical protein
MWLVHQFDSLFHLGVCKEYPIMAKTKTPRTTSPRTKKNVAELPVTPVVTASETSAPEVRNETAARSEMKPQEVRPTVQAPVAEVKAEIKAVETREPRKTFAEARHMVVPINLEEEIRRRAYQLYEERGCTPGHENDDWLVAEREILTRYTTQRAHSASA